MAHRSRHNHGKSDRPSGRGGDTFRNNYGSRSFHDWNWETEKNSVKLPETNNLKKKGKGGKTKRN